MWSNKRSDIWLQWICSNENRNELYEKYEQWADTYETDIFDVWGPVPKAAAQMISKYLNNKSSQVVDIGAGTGLAGVKLFELGFKKIIGIDISPKMLNIAKKKNVYRSLICCSIGDATFNNLPSANGIIATGVFAEGHAGAIELSMLPKKIYSGGVLVLTARQSFLPKLHDVINNNKLILLNKTLIPIYTDPICLMAFNRR